MILIQPTEWPATCDLGSVVVCAIGDTYAKTVDVDLGTAMATISSPLSHLYGADTTLDWQVALSDNSLIETQGGPKGLRTSSLCTHVLMCAFDHFTVHMSNTVQKQSRE
nr:hypothetical protein CFP56_34676 [Quercus suber]